jgi:hypothetical protein
MRVENRSNRRKTCHSITLFTTNLTWDGLKWFSRGEICWRISTHTHARAHARTQFPPTRHNCLHILCQTRRTNLSLSLSGCAKHFHRRCGTGVHVVLRTSYRCHSNNVVHSKNINEDLMNRLMYLKRSCLAKPASCFFIILWFERVYISYGWCELGSSRYLNESERAWVSEEFLAADETGDELVVCVDKVTVHWGVKLLAVRVQGTHTERRGSSRRLWNICMKTVEVIARRRSTASLLDSKSITGMTKKPPAQNNYSRTVDRVVSFLVQNTRSNFTDVNIACVTDGTYV